MAPRSVDLEGHHVSGVVIDLDITCKRRDRTMTAIRTFANPTPGADGLKPIGVGHIKIVRIHQLIGVFGLTPKADGVFS